MITRARAAVFCLLILGCWAVPLQAQVLGSITMKDGSIIHGEIVNMTDGKLRLKAAFGAGEPFEIKWADVTQIATGQPVTLILEDGTSIKGTIQKTEPGTLEIAADPVSIAIPILLSSVTAINAPTSKAVAFRANVSAAAKVSEGNTEDKQVNLLSNFHARSKNLRLTAEARWFYAEERGKVTDRNAFATQKLDIFVTQRWYGYVGALFEQDTFDDLDLRSTVTIGPGYELIEEGDFERPYLNKMTLSGDAGFGFFSENRKLAEDVTHAVFRWGMNFNWPVTATVTIFHTQQGFPNAQDPNDLYINTSQGIRFGVWRGLEVGLQVIYKYDNAPPPNTQKGDLKGLLTVGWNLDW